MHYLAGINSIIKMSAQFENTVNVEMNVNECSVCYEAIQRTNNCITPCGHAFCFTCMSKCLQQNNSCPICRTVLVEQEEEDDEDDEDGEEDSDEDDEDDEDDDDDEEDNDLVGDVETIAEKFAEKGYTLVDAISMILNRFKSKDSNKYTEETIERMFDTFEEIVVDTDTAIEEQNGFAEEDADVQIVEKTDDLGKISKIQVYVNRDVDV